MTKYTIKLQHDFTGQKCRMMFGSLLRCVTSVNEQTVPNSQRHQPLSIQSRLSYKFENGTVGKSHVVI